MAANYKIVWSESATESLKEVWHYIAQDNRAAADGFVDQVLTRVDLLKSFPESGVIYKKSRNRVIREIIVGNYRVIYQIFDSQQFVEILLVWHGARQEPRV